MAWRNNLKWSVRKTWLYPSRNVGVQTSPYLVKDTTKLSYIHGTSDKPLLGMTIGQLLQSKANLHPDREAFVFHKAGVRWTYGQLNQKCDELAAGYLRLNIGRGDRVAVLAPNVPEYILSQYALARIGAVMVCINPGYKECELAYALNKVGCKAIVAAESFKAHDYHGTLSAINPEMERCVPGELDSKRCPNLKTVIIISEKSHPGTYRFQDVLGTGHGSHINDVHNLQSKLNVDDGINIQYTSGTTGHPKGVVLTHHNVVNNAYFSGKRMGHHEKPSRHCSPYPLFHCSGLTFGSLLAVANGGTLVLPAPSFDPVATLEAAEKERCDALSAVPTMYIDMLKQAKKKEYDLSRLQTGIIGGAPVPEELSIRIRERLNLTDLTLTYGLTECSPAIFQCPIDCPVELKHRSVGMPGDHVEVKIRNERGDTVPLGEVGEICVRGYNVMKEYWGDPQKTREAKDEDGWFSTGDLGKLDENGYGYVMGRIKDMVIRGGENIYTAEIEQFFHTHHKVDDVHVVGVPDERLGEELCAFVRLHKDTTATEDEMRHFGRSRIAHFKVPKYMFFTKEFPMTASNKVQKFRLQEIAIRLLEENDIGRERTSGV
ncbi:medium-chain acyl-CoA ligase ACSF2, mitochondrial-like [Lineus longissimus]|uniref:medium-chain acyl-CoA ligase ACSF2, mitochondrial-like n=1 Tax=Lineus longissimus TaxID=88925 RepID=UPI002B4DB6E3